jgi:LacI family transcriptional regulator
MKDPLSKRPTQRDIASACGVSQMAVSLALRGSKKVSGPVRLRILKLAKKLNWYPDPALSALMAYRYRRAATRHPSTIAWLTNWPTREGWRSDHPVYAAYFNGAAARAASLGYKLEEFWLDEPGMTPARMSRILYTRGITGVLLPPQPRAHSHLRLDWEKFAAVTFGFTLTKPSLHVATNYHFRSSVIALRKLRSLGYRRVGIVLDQRYDTRVGYSWLAGCLMEQRRYAPEEIVPTVSLKQFSRDALNDYLRQQQPDALLTNFWSVGEWLCELGIAVPREIGLAYLSVTERNPSFSGINENSHAIGEAALDLLATMIQRNEFGVPAIPRRIMIEGYWVPGKTVRRVNKPAPELAEAVMEF